MNPATGIRITRKGFTAIEITAVATIIAILALILIPLLQERVEKTRLVAAKADLQQLMKAEMIVKADINQYVRLQDLDNTTSYDLPADFTPPNEDIVDADLAVPHAFWNVEINDTTRHRIAQESDQGSEGMWQGPYMTFNHFSSINTLLDEGAGVYFWGLPGNPDITKPVAGGPIFLTSRDDPDDKHPTDPWGRPYLFFGPGILLDDDLFLSEGTTSGTPPAPVTNETDFKNSVIYSMGPDAQPGDGKGLTPINLLRGNPIPVLGEQGSDDLQVQF